MSNKFLLKDTRCQTPSTSCNSQSGNKINWALCVICQQERNETLTNPMLMKRKDAGSAYTSLLKINELNELPRTIHINRLDEGEGLGAALVVKKALWHQSCRLAFNKTKVQRAERRALKKSSSSGDGEIIAGPRKRTRRHTTSTWKPAQETLFFCCKPGDTDGFREAATFQLDNRVRTCAELLEDT